MTAETLTGRFTYPLDANVPADQFVFIDKVPGAVATAGVASAYTNGLVRVQPIDLRPSLMETWSLLGWSLRARVGYVQQGAPVGGPWARWGDVWAGLTVDRPMDNIGGGVFFNNVGLGIVQSPKIATEGRAQLPEDLSTFAKLWRPDDPLPLFQNDFALNGWPAGGTARMAPVALLNMLPIPLALNTGLTLQMVLIVTPSIHAMVVSPGVGELLHFALAEVAFTVFYDRENR